MNHQIDDRKKCELCNRKFASDRLEKHIEICKKQKEKKRTTFDSYKQRQIIDQNDENGDSMNKPKLNKSKAKIVKPVTRPVAKPSSITSSNKTTIKTANEIKKTTSTKDLNGSSEINNKMENGKINGNINETINEINNQDDKKSKWRENHEEFIKSIQSAKKINGNSFDSNDEKTHKQNGNESIDKIDKESTITVNSDSTTSTGNGTVNTNGSNGSFNNANEKSTDEDNHINGNSEKSKPTQRKIQPPQSRLNKGKLNQVNGQQLNKQSNGQKMMNGSTTTLNSANSNHNSNNVGTRKSMNTAHVECTICGRKFNRAAGERHIPWCAEQSQRKNSSNNTNEEALARFRARNAYRSTKGLKKRERDKSVPNEKKEDKYVRQSSLRRALSTIDGLDQVFNNKVQLNNSTNLNNKRSTSQVNLNRQSKYKDNHQTVKKLQINAHSKSSSASSSKGSTQHNTNQNNNNNNNNYSAGLKEQAQSRVKARLNQQQKIQKQRMNSTYPKTPIMKFKDKFPNHSNKLIEFADSQQFSQMFKKHLNNSTELNNMPKTVPGVRTGGLSPTKDMHRNNGHHIEDMNDLEQLRARIKEMYLSSNNGNHSQNDLLDYHLTNNEFHDNSFTRENSSSKIKSSKSVNDFLTLNDGFNDFISDIDLSKNCNQCGTGYITMSARYCYSCGARRPLL